MAPVDCWVSLSCLWLCVALIRCPLVILDPWVSALRKLPRLLSRLLKIVRLLLQLWATWLITVCRCANSSALLLRLLI